MKNKLLKWSLAFGAISFTPIVLIACNSEINNTPKNDTQDKMKLNEKISVSNLMVENLESNQATLSLIVFHQDLDYSKNYQLVFQEFDITAKKVGNLVKSDAFKFDETQNSTSLDQKNGIDREAEIQKQYHNVIWFQTTSSEYIETSFPPLATEKVQQINITGLVSNKIYLSISINDENNQLIWQKEQQKTISKFETLETEFYQSDKVSSHRYDETTKEFVITYYLNTKKIIELETQWSYKLKLEIEKIENETTKLNSHYLSLPYKSENFDTLNNDVAFEVRVPANSSDQQFTIKNATIAATWTLPKKPEQNPEDSSIEFTYINTIKPILNN